ncbi:MAG: hypothetical protein ACLPY1_22795 [Terracidiphilus sp.]
MLASIRDAGVAEADFLAKLDAVAVDAFDEECTETNPRYPLISDFRAILLDSFHGRPFVELSERQEIESTTNPVYKANNVSMAEVKAQEPVLTR